MRRFVTIIITGIMFGAGGASAQSKAQVSPQQYVDQMQRTLAALYWKVEPATYKVDSANATFRVVDGEALVVGPDAVRAMRALQGRNGFDNTQALVMRVSGPTEGTFVFMEHHAVGYVADADWSDVDTDALLAGLTEKTLASNAERAQSGLPPLTILGWSEPPHYEKATGTAYWAVRLNEGNAPLINAVAMKLSRNGFSKMTWVGQPDMFINAKATVLPWLDRYKFDTGWRYADFISGDKVAAFTIAGLTATMVTGKSGKVAAAATAGAVAVALAFAKKAWFLIFLPFVFAWKWIRGRGRNANSAS